MSIGVEQLLMAYMVEHIPVLDAEGEAKVSEQWGSRDLVRRPSLPCDACGCPLQFRVTYGYRCASCWSALLPENVREPLNAWFPPYRIHYLYGDICSSDLQTVVNPVNCEGVMGLGLALTIRRWVGEHYFRAYQADCASGRLRIGRPTLYRDHTPWILNFPTKFRYAEPSTLAFVDAGLAYLTANFSRSGISSIALPKLGCGAGGLSWQSVGPLMASSLGTFPTSSYLAVYVDQHDTRFQP